MVASGRKCSEPKDAWEGDGTGGVSFSLPSGGVVFVSRWTDRGEPDNATSQDWDDAKELIAAYEDRPNLLARIRELEDALDNMEIGQFRGEWLQEANRKWENREEEQMPELLWVCRCRELLMAMQQAHGILAAKGGA